MASAAEAEYGALFLNGQTSSVPGYVTAALQQFRHKLKNTRQSSPHHHVPPTYGARVKFTELEDDTPLLPEERLKFIQQVVGVF